MSVSKTVPPICLRPFQPEDQPAVKALILAGLVEHWGWLDPTKNPDLEDIAHSYAGAIFLVAVGKVTCDKVAGGEEIVGCGALVPRQDGTAEIVRMSVSAACRRKGIGQMILQALVARARQAGYQRLVLETTETWQEVIAFYVSFGFRITHHQDGDVYFEWMLINGDLAD